MKELNVKVGDEILYVTTFGGGYPSEYIATVTKVTPTGRIRIDRSEFQFDKYGKMMGRDSYRRSSIHELTTEKKKEMEEERFIQRCINEFHDKREMLTYDQAVKIMEVLNMRSADEVAD